MTPGDGKLLPSDRKLRTRRQPGFGEAFCLAGSPSNLSACHLQRCPVGGCRCKRAHWRGALPTCPPASLTAVCRTMWSPRCSRQNNPHSYTHESVHLAPRAHIKPPEPHRHGDTGKPLQVLLLWHLADRAGVRYCSTSSPPSSSSSESLLSIEKGPPSRGGCTG